MILDNREIVLRRNARIADIARIVAIAPVRRPSYVHVWTGRDTRYRRLESKERRVALFQEVKKLLTFRSRRIDADVGAIAVIKVPPVMNRALPTVAHFER